MLKRLYEWIMRLAASRHATVALFLLAFGESFIVPVPPDAMLAPMVLARPDRAWLNASVCAAGSVLGGIVGYVIGFALQPAAHWMLAHSGHGAAEPSIHAAFAKYGVAVILSGVVPLVPFPLITLSSGLAHFSLWQFVVAAAVARLARFFAIAAIVKRFGARVVLMMEQRLALAAACAIALTIAAVVVLELIHHG